MKASLAFSPRNIAVECILFFEVGPRSTMQVVRRHFGRFFCLKRTFGRRAIVVRSNSILIEKMRLSALGCLHWHARALFSSPSCQFLSPVYCILTFAHSGSVVNHKGSYIFIVRHFIGSGVEWRRRLNAISFLCPDDFVGDFRSPPMERGTFMTGKQGCGVSDRFCK